MGKYEKLLEQILLGNSDTNVDFDELANCCSGWGLKYACVGAIISLENRVLKKGSIFSGTAAKRKCIKSVRYDR